MRHRLYLHISWTTRDREPTITRDFVAFLARFLPLIARQERAHVLAIGAVRTHVHVVVRINPATMLPRLLQRWKGGSSLIGARDGLGGSEPIRWAKGSDLESVSPRALGAAIEYVKRQSRRHPAEAIAGLEEVGIETIGADAATSPSAT